MTDPITIMLTQHIQVAAKESCDFFIIISPFLFLIFVILVVFNDR